VIRRGFTLIEILIVVGLIALLSSLLVMGLNHMQTNAKRQQTMMTLVSLQGMYADYDQTLHRHFVSYQDDARTYPAGDVRLSNGDMACPQNVSLDYFNSNSGAGTGTISVDRQGWAVLMTRDVMAQFKLTSTNNASIGKMSAASLMRFTPSTAAAPLPYNPSNPYSIATASSRVYVGAAPPYVYYTAIQNNPLVSGVSVAPPDPNYWFPSTYFGDSPTSPTVGTPDNSAPVPLDAWGNPIIFVPGGSLGNGSVYGPGSGALVAGGISITARSPDGRPFFASAGPDGDFSKGDDNLYSFEK
jgi:prepilin-type N-terminal cleavage/methylation domain-containing protein